MVDKYSLAFILTSDTPTTSDSRLVTVRKSHRSTRALLPSGSNYLSSLTAYLKLPVEAPRMDCVRLQQLHTVNQLLSGDPTPLNTECDRKSSKFCVADGCTSRAKHARRCWKHGGSVKCKMPHCANRAKSKGVCWSHGGGSSCSVDQCDTIAVSNGYCWAHGGGKRCRARGCLRPAYERTCNYCVAHFEDLTAAATTTVW